MRCARGHRPLPPRAAERSRPSNRRSPLPPDRGERAALSGAARGRGIDRPYLLSLLRKPACVMAARPTGRRPPAPVCSQRERERSMRLMAAVTLSRLVHQRLSGWGCHVDRVARQGQLASAVRSDFASPSTNSRRNPPSSRRPPPYRSHPLQRCPTATLHAVGAFAGALDCCAPERRQLVARRLGNRTTAVQRRAWKSIAARQRLTARIRVLSAWVSPSRQSRVRRSPQAGRHATPRRTLRPWTRDGPRLSHRVNVPLAATTDRRLRVPSVPRARPSDRCQRQRQVILDLDSIGADLRARPRSYSARNVPHRARLSPGIVFAVCAAPPALPIGIIWLTT